jgi:hypothetical protein
MIDGSAGGRKFSSFDFVVGFIVYRQKDFHAQPQLTLGQGPSLAGPGDTSGNP